jgi:catechol 2,3-dioxygenase-like lactoylglutathione lyase family enzyme
MTRYLHTMYRITDPEKSRAFYEALGFECRRDLPIVRDGEVEATKAALGSASCRIRIVGVLR